MARSLRQSFPSDINKSILSCFIIYETHSLWGYSTKLARRNYRAFIFWNLTPVSLYFSYPFLTLAATIKKAIYMYT